MLQPFIPSQLVLLTEGRTRESKREEEILSFFLFFFLGTRREDLSNQGTRRVYLVAKFIRQFESAKKRRSNTTKGKKEKKIDTIFESKKTSLSSIFILSIVLALPPPPLIRGDRKRDFLIFKATFSSVLFSCLLRFFLRRSEGRATYTSIYLSIRQECMHSSRKERLTSVERGSLRRRKTKKEGKRQTERSLTRVHSLRIQADGSFPT